MQNRSTVQSLNGDALVESVPPVDQVDLAA